MVRTRCVRVLAAWALAIGCIVLLAIGEHRLPGDFAIIIIVALVFAFFFVKYGFPAFVYLRYPSYHTVAMRVASWGDPIHLAVEVEREARSPRDKGGGWLVTDKYLVQSTFFMFDVLRFRDLLWAYKQTTRHSINFIPTGKTYDAVLVCYGGTAMVNGTEKMVDGILAFAADRAPWAVIGFSKELEEQNFQDLCAVVEQRRSDWEH